MHIFKDWLPLAFLATLLCALVYVSVQQSLRQSANDPQIQMAEDAAVGVGGGAQAQSLVLTGTVNIGESLSPYFVFYNAAGIPTGGSGLLHGQFPSLPAGIFNYVRASGETRVTWQPEPGVRSAIVVMRIGGGQQGFVMAGRSLREVERREDQLSFFAGAAWIATLIGTFALKALATLWK